jgi:Cyclin, N-terminal domain
MDHGDPDHDDFTLRAPIPLQYYPVHDRPVEYDSQARPYVSVLWVGAHVLRLSEETRFTAAVLFHRYSLRATKENEASCGMKRPRDEQEYQTERMLVVAICLFLASKTSATSSVGEDPVRIRDVLNVVQSIRVEHGDDDSKQILLRWIDQQDDEADYLKRKKEIVTLEQHVLRFLSFDIAVIPPHRAVVLLVRQALSTSSTTQLLQKRQGSSSKKSKPSEEKDRRRNREPGPQQQREIQQRYHRVVKQIQHDVVHASIRYLHDGCFSVESLTHSVMATAVAAITLAVPSVLSNLMALHTPVSTSRSSSSSLHVSPVDLLISTLGGPIWWKQWVPLDVSEIQVQTAVRSLQKASESLSVRNGIDETSL